MPRFLRSPFTLSLCLTLAQWYSGSPALAELRVLHSRFTDRVENGLPVAPADSLHTASTVTYWLELANSDSPTTVTLIWRFDGREVARQTLEVGRSSRWRTWGSWRPHGAHAVEIQLIDSRGATLRSEQLTLRTGTLGRRAVTPR